MKKRTIVIASVLKPVDDTRAFEKFGISCSDSGNYNVIIIGYPSTVKPAYPNITFLPHKAFSRLSIQRLFVPLKIMIKTFQVKHDILIVNTHELLIVALLNRILFGRTILYDIQENYYRNIRFTKAFPKLVRSILALLVRCKEKFTAPFFHWFFLAEKGYEKEFSFTRGRTTILENKPKMMEHFVQIKRPNKTQLLFTGTLAESTGVFRAIELAKSLHKLDSEITLHIIGYAAQHEVYLKIKNETSAYDFIHLVGGNFLVPHSEIMKAIMQADFGIIAYPFSPHTQNSMPTKLYEYVAARLPILLQDYNPWVQFCDTFQGALILEEGMSAVELLSRMKSKVFYTKKPVSISWKDEEGKLLHLLNKIIP